MKKLAILALIALTVSVKAQTIDTFTTAGTWDAFGLTATQTGDGFITVTGVDNNNNTAEKFLPSAIFLDNGSTLISVTAKLGGANAASNFGITFVNDGTSAVIGSAVFNTSSFNSLTYTTVTSLITAGSGVGQGVEVLRIQGSTVSGTAALNISFDSISAVPAVVPEPSTYASLAGIAALGFVAYRRRRVAA